MRRTALAAAATCCAVHLAVLATIGTAGVALGASVLVITVLALSVAVLTWRMRRPVACVAPIEEDEASAVNG